MIHKRTQAINVGDGFHNLSLRLKLWLQPHSSISILKLFDYEYFWRQQSVNIFDQETLRSSLQEIEYLILSLDGAYLLYSLSNVDQFNLLYFFFCYTFKAYRYESHRFTQNKFRAATIPRGQIIDAVQTNLLIRNHTFKLWYSGQDSKMAVHPCHPGIFAFLDWQFGLEEQIRRDKSFYFKIMEWGLCLAGTDWQTYFLMHIQTDLLTRRQTNCSKWEARTIMAGC